MSLKARVDRIRVSALSRAAVAVLFLVWLPPHQAMTSASQSIQDLDMDSGPEVYEDADVDANGISFPPLPSIIKGPYLLWPTKDSMSVVWETDLPSPSRIEYGRTSSGECGVEDSNLVTLHTMRLTGLEPASRYRFKVASGGRLGSRGSFRTAPLGPGRSFRFAVYGDTQGGQDIHAAIVQSMMDRRPAIVFHCGDLVGIGREYEFWESEFFAPARRMMQTRPFVPVPGNHEYFGSGPLWFFDFFGPPSEGGWWAMSYGDVRFIGLNTNLDSSPGSLQYEWLSAEMQSSDFMQAHWRIVFFHQPPYSSSNVHQEDLAVQTYLVPLFERYGVHMVFSGHSHAYERYSQNGITYIVTGGGGGPLYELLEDTVPPIREVGASLYHHCIVDVDVPGQSLRLKAVDIDGQVFDTLSVNSAPPACQICDRPL